MPTNRSSDVLQVLLETCIMQFVSPNTNNHAFEYKTSKVEARLWVQQMECWTWVGRVALPPQGCYRQACPLQPRATTVFKHRCAEPYSAKRTWCSCRWALVVSAEADCHSQHLSLTSASSLCLWQG